MPKRNATRAKGPKPNPGESTVEQRLAETLLERDTCSKTCIYLIATLENLIKRFKHCMVVNKSVQNDVQAEDAVRWEREAIKRARRGR